MVLFYQRITECTKNLIVRLKSIFLEDICKNEWPELLWYFTSKLGSEDRESKQLEIIYLKTYHAVVKIHDSQLL